MYGNKISGWFTSYKPYQFDKNKLIESKIGIYNIGGSCYMASIIQILIHLEKFLDYYEKNRINSNLCNKFDGLLQQIEKTHYPIEINDLANYYNLLNKKFKGTKGNNPMTFFNEFIRDLQKNISTLFTGKKNIQIKKGNKLSNYDEQFIFHMVTLDENNTQIDLLEENIKELENDKNCKIIEKIKKLPEILVINLEIDNIVIDFKNYEELIASEYVEVNNKDNKNNQDCNNSIDYTYYLKGINEYSNIHSVA